MTRPDRHQNQGLTTKRLRTDALSAVLRRGFRCVDVERAFNRLAGTVSSAVDLTVPNPREPYGSWVNASITPKLAKMAAKNITM